MRRKYESQHTGGSWDTACDSYGKVQHSRKYDCVYTVVNEGNGDRILTVAARIENPEDARLIAAAPRLLRFVQKMAEDEAYPRALAQWLLRCVDSNQADRWDEWDATYLARQTPRCSCRPEAWSPGLSRDMCPVHGTEQKEGTPCNQKQ